MNLLKLALVAVTPSDSKEGQEPTRLTRGVWKAEQRQVVSPGVGATSPPGPPHHLPDAPRRGPMHPCLDVEAITQIMAELSNKGARELGFADTGAMWRSNYDMPPDEFAKELDRLWEQVRPLYVSLHAYVRMKLREKYGDAVPPNGPIPAHLLGNIWAQDWANIYDARSRRRRRRPGFDLTDILKRARRRRRSRWSATASASSPRSGSSRCRRRSGSARCS